MGSSKFEQTEHIEKHSPILESLWSEEEIKIALSKVINENFAVKMFLKSLKIGSFDAFNFIPKLITIAAKDKEGLEILKETGIANMIELNKNG